MVSSTLRGLRAGDRPEIAEILESSGAFRTEEIAIGLELVDETLEPRPLDRLSLVRRRASRPGRRLRLLRAGPDDRGDLRPLLDRRRARGPGHGSRDQARRGRDRRRSGPWAVAGSWPRRPRPRPIVPAHAFYARRGYRLLGRIEDFYRAGRRPADLRQAAATKDDPSMFRISHVLGTHREHDRRCIAEVQALLVAAFPDLADVPDYIERKLAEQTDAGLPDDPPDRPRAGRPRHGLRAGRLLRVDRLRLPRLHRHPGRAARPGPRRRPLRGPPRRT